ncbi:hypothetical protein TNCV_2410031 [Trichonephila clavipes]|nr:hypothetical protein TNCV_2410031 [Trichonephila clavipes]
MRHDLFAAGTFDRRGYAKIGADVSASLSLLKVLLQSTVQMNLCFASVSLWSGLAIVEKFFTNSGNTCIIPRNFGASEHPSGSSSLSQPRSYPGLFVYLLPK